VFQYESSHMRIHAYPSLMRFREAVRDLKKCHERSETEMSAIVSKLYHCART